MSGALTATQLADRLDETPANCSWHLRKLAEHAFVEEAGGGIGRQRPWQVRSVGLAWDDACLHFERNPQPTLTASAAQVRQPIYRSSVGLWRRYERELAPLRRHFENAGVRIDDAPAPTHAGATS